MSLIWGNKYASHSSLRSELTLDPLLHTHELGSAMLYQSLLWMSCNPQHTEALSDKASPQWWDISCLMQLRKGEGRWFSPCQSFWGWLHMRRCQRVVSSPMSLMGKVCLTKYLNELESDNRVWVRKKWHSASAAEAGKAEPHGPASMHPCWATAAAGTCRPHCCRQNVASCNRPGHVQRLEWANRVAAAVSAAALQGSAVRAACLSSALNSPLPQPRYL